MKIVIIVALISMFLPRIWTRHPLIADSQLADILCHGLALVASRVARGHPGSDCLALLGSDRTWPFLVLLCLAGHRSGRRETDGGGWCDGRSLWRIRTGIWRHGGGIYASRYVYSGAALPPKLASCSLSSSVSTRYHWGQELKLSLRLALWVGHRRRNPTFSTWTPSLRGIGNWQELAYTS